MSQEADTLKATVDVIGCISLLEFVLPLTLADANESYFLWCLSSWSLKAEGYLNLLLTVSQCRDFPGACAQATALRRTGSLRP